MNASEIFDRYLNKLMEMKKSEIVNEGIVWGFWAESSRECRMKDTKRGLARELADRLTRKEVRGY